MAYRRRKQPRNKKRQYRRKMNYRRRRRVPRRTFRRRANSENLVNAKFSTHILLNEKGGTNNAHGIQFTLDNFSGSGTDKYKVLYDLYRIKKIKYEIRTRATASVFASGTAGGYIVHALDWDDNTTWADITEARNSWGAKTCNAIGGFTRYFSPRCINALKLATGSATYVDSPRVSPWISVTAGATAHYGVKWVSALGGLTTVTYPFDELVTIYVQFKHRTGKA